MATLHTASESSRGSRLLAGITRHPEATLFWVLALAHLAPVWYFRYVPTQDGPAHLNNAQIIRDIGDPATGYADLFELWQRGDGVPIAWTHEAVVAATVDTLLLRPR